MNDIAYSSHSSTRNVNSVLKSAFMGVGVELSFYAVAMYIGMQMGLGFISSMVFWGLSFVVLFFLERFKNSMIGFGLANLIAILLGLSAAPAMEYYLVGNYLNEVIMAATTTAALTFGLSFYAATTKKDFSFLGGFIFSVIIGMIVIGLLNVFLFKSPFLSLLISYVGVIIFSLAILYEVNKITNDPNANWITASVGIFISMINLFWSLLRIFANRD